MSFFTQLAPGPAGMRLALGVAVQVTGVVAFSALASAVFLRRRAAARHALWLGALVWVLFSPAIAALTDRVGFRTWEVGPSPATIAAQEGSPPWAEPVSVASATLPAPGVAGHADVETATESLVMVKEPRSSIDPGDFSEPRRSEASGYEPMSRNVASAHASSVRDIGARGSRWSDAAPGALVLVWALGVLVGLGRIACGWLWLTRLIREARPIDAERCEGEAGAVLRGAAASTVYESPAVTGPVVVGVIRPRIVLPERVVGALDGPAMRDVLAHEYAHVRRGDARVGLLQRLAAALFWPHPLVHVLNVQLSRAREEVCDNHVLACRDPCGYARTLLALTELCRPCGRPHAGIGLLAVRWTLAARVSGLLDPRRSAMTTTSLRGRIATVVALTIAGLAMAGIRFDRTTRAEAPDKTEARISHDPPRPDDPGRPLRGIVVDEAGRPVGGATVRPVYAERTAEEAVTAADGTFTLALRGRLLLRHDLVAEAEGGLRIGLLRYEEPRDSRPPDPSRIVLKPSRPLAAHVTDAAGAAVAGATVVALDHGYCGRTTFTGADGAAALHLPLDGKVRWVIAFKTGAGFDYVENYRWRGDLDIPPMPPDVRLSLDGARTVRVKALDSAGRPLGGVHLGPLYIGKPGRIAEVNLGGLDIRFVSTGADGLAAFGWLPDRVDEGVPFAARSERFSCPDLAVYQGPQSTELETRLLRKTRLSGSVRLPDGGPAAGILIQADGRGTTNRHSHYFTRTRSDGAYAVDVDAEQSYVVGVIDGQWASPSRDDVIIREGKPRSGIDFSLTRGTVIRGQVTEKPDHQPVPEKTVTLIQECGTLPEEVFEKRGRAAEIALQLNQFVRTDAEGRYVFRVGPGRFRLVVHPLGLVDRLTIGEGGGADVIRDVVLPVPRRLEAIRGVVIEKAPSGDRPLAGAIVQVASVGRFASSSLSIADAKGRFALERPIGRSAKNSGKGGLVLYARGRDGRVAGFTVVADTADDVKAFVSEASRVSGRVVDGDGRPRAGRQVIVDLTSPADSRSATRFQRRIRTDERGRFTLDDIVVGSRCEVWVVVDGDDPPRVSRSEPILVRGPDPIELPDLILASKKADDATVRPAVPGAGVPRAKPKSALAWLSPAEVDDLIRMVGRDPMSPDLRDRVLLTFQPRILWSSSPDRTRERLADREFVRRIDAAARRTLGRPANTLELIRWANRYDVGYDDALLDHHFRKEDAEQKVKPVDVTGTVRDGQSGLPVAHARIFTDEAITRTDDSGRFALKTRPFSVPGFERIVPVWVEGEGYAVREAVAQPDAQPDSIIHLIREVEFAGRVIDDRGRPVAEAVVQANVSRDAVCRDARWAARGGNIVALTVRSDGQGWFSVPGVPPSEQSVQVRVDHPEYQRVETSKVAPTTRDEPLFITLKRGCVVEGTVVDEAGRPVAGASVDIRKPSSMGYEQSASSDARGSFRFRNVSPGSRDLLVQPARLAPARLPIVTDPARPVRTQVVVVPGAYISGKVVGEDDAPVADVAVGWVESLGGEFRNLNRMTCSAADGTFRLGPLPPVQFQITCMADSPRRVGKVWARPNQTDVVIRITSDPNHDR